MFSNLFNAAETWIAVAYVIGMFTVLAFRPQQIGMPYTFRLSYIFFAMYFIIPSIITGLVSISSMDGGMRGGGGGTYTLVVFQLSSIAGKVLLALSIVFALSSLKRHAGTGSEE